ncbi:response regulator transcription factor [Dyadobacter sediminis]|uniref:Response regulator transcription factor n=1 Tax=Dyadobacter sediminis TaxID=1493691 RepID=A0A5R9KK32_9BACT|nr:response regulator transcription factor [Dyadobacter sediminis]TLU96426.1 response regulator transcription factor [Dyadobacter sediminis]GGB82130.1 DNA-binding response regulator [Dyadobacter sediminis]
MMIKVVVYDDHKSRREALELLISLQPGMECTGSYENCAGLVKNLASDPPTVVLMDINMPKVGGIEGVKLLKQHYPETSIIMQTVFEEDDTIFKCIQAGANGYILKKAPNDKLIEAIYDVVNGGAPITPSIAARILNYFSKKKPSPEKRNFDLSKRETDILTKLVKGQSHKMIAEDLFISVHTVHNHVKRLYQKLHVHSVSEAVVKAIENRIVQH